MFDNIITALIQALGFSAVFGYFVYQLLFEEKKTIQEKTKIINNKVLSRNNSNQSMKKGLFYRKSESLEVTKPKKSGFFNRIFKTEQEEVKSIKKRWFN